MRRVNATRPANLTGSPRLVCELAGIMHAWCAPGGASSRTHSHDPRLVRELAAQGDNFEGCGGHWWKSENNGFVCTERSFGMVEGHYARLVRAWCALAGASSRTKRA